MYQVLLADDEPAVLASVLAGIDWEGLNLQVAGTAGSGQEALALAREKKIDIAVLDIRMPGLSGLEVCECLHRENEEMQLIIISGYAEFSYAERAIRYGVVGYCLKPIEYEELTRFLLKAEKNCEKRTVQTSGSDILEALEKGEKESLTGILGNAGLSGGIYVTVSVGEKPLKPADGLTVELGKEQYGYFTSRRFRPGEMEQWLRKKGSRGIGYEEAPVEDVGQLGNVISSCQVRSFQYFVNPETRLCGKMEGSRGAARLNRLWELVGKNKWEQVIQWLREAQENGWRDFTALQALKICNMVHSGSLFKDEESDYYVYSLRQLAAEYQNICRMFEGLVADIQDAMKTEKTYSYTNTAFMELMAYITENYRKDISLSSAAKSCHMSANYVSQLFKKETGTTFVHYITQLRMDEAIRLLETTRKSAAEISDAVGFNDYFYFLKIFKKYTGKTVSQYRQEL